MTFEEQRNQWSESRDPVGSEAEQYRADLHQYLMRRLRCAEDARDLAQEAYLRYLQLPDAGVLRRPDGYLFRIAMNLLYEWKFRRDRSAVTFDSELADLSSSTWMDESLDLSERLGARERLQKVLDRIPATYRRVLLMNKAEGLSYQQIARQLNLSPSTVLKYLARATAHARQVQAEIDRA